MTFVFFWWNTDRAGGIIWAQGKQEVGDEGPAMGSWLWLFLEHPWLGLSVLKGLLQPGRVFDSVISISTCPSVLSRGDKGSAFFSPFPFKRGLWLITSEIPNNPSYICINKVSHVMPTEGGVYIKGRLKVG